MLREIYSTYLINIPGLEEYVVTSDGDIYKKPYKSKSGRSYGWRKIKMQYPSRWRLNNSWYSVYQLKPKLFNNPTPQLISNDLDK